ncbi:MAG: CoA transferase [Negativicutes bacterium]|nr:CoA transferase [Negativicutes bacterium]
MGSEMCIRDRYCTMILADYGADVIKVEMPRVGDDARQYGPFVGGESVYFAAINRGKRSITVNMKKPEGKEIVQRLLVGADVLVQNFRPGTMEKYGLGYADVKEFNPRLIYVSGSGYGQTGPWSRKAAYDMAIQGLGGFMSLTGEPDGDPTKSGPSIMDLLTGILMAQGTLTALYARERTGRGQLVDVAMLDSSLSILENALTRYALTKKVPTRVGNRHPSITPFGAFRAKDDLFILAVGNDKLWQAFCDLVKRPDWAEDERFATNHARTINEKILKEMLEELFASRTVAEWVEMIDAIGIPCAPVNSMDKVLEHPQIKARDMVVTLKHPVIGDLPVAGLPVKLSDTPGAVEKPAPLLGEHTGEILRSLGYSQAEIDRLQEGSVI